MGHLQHLPYEVVSLIAKELELDDIFNLSLTNKDFSFLAREESICRLLIELRAAASTEAQCARNDPENWSYARALRTLIKRRRALACDGPYLVAVVGICDVFKYCNGTLVYILGRGKELDRRLRILDLHNPTLEEYVVDIAALLEKCSINPIDGEGYDFDILHYAEGVVTCLYKSYEEEPTLALIAFKPLTGEVVIFSKLTSKCRLFVRNTANYLYYGIQTTHSYDSLKRWVISGFRNSGDGLEWEEYDHKLELDSINGSDISTNICFEIIDDHFYVLSSLTALDIQEVDFNNYFSCVRFPVAEPHAHAAHITTSRHIWRRNHREGPTDERWTVLRLGKDEETGEVEILESRKEWVHGQNEILRTHYRKPVRLPREPSCSESVYSNTSLKQYIRCRPRRTPTWQTWGIEAPIKKVGMESDVDRSYEDLETPETRDPRKVHHSDTGETLTKTVKTFIRSYHGESQASVDLVDDPSPASPDSQRLRLKLSSRRLRPTPAGGTSIKDLTTEQAIEKLYQQEIKMWPDYPTDKEGNDPRYDQLESIMNPPSHHGNVHGTWDERSIVYATGGDHHDMQALVFISFDPSIRMPGIPSWDPKRPRSRPLNSCDGVKGDKHAIHRGGTGKATGKAKASAQAPCPPPRKRGRTTAAKMDVEGDVEMVEAHAVRNSADSGIGMGGGGGGETYRGSSASSSGSRKFSRRSGSSSTSTSSRESSEHGGWIWKEKAMYLNVTRGYDFSA